MTGNKFRRAALALGIAGLALVGGCRNAEPEAPVENDTTNFIETANAMDVNSTDTAAPEPIANAAPLPSRSGEGEFANDSSTIDDAEASGMTSRLPDDEETQPAEQAKE
jgi:hypothetical protein